EQQIEVAHLALAREDALQDFRRPGGAFAALRALRARLVRVEARQPHRLVDHVRRVVEYDYAARAQHRALLDASFVVEQRALGLLAVQHRYRRSAGDAGLERATLPHAARQLVQQVLQREAERHLVITGLSDVATDAEQLRPRALGVREAHFLVP